MLLMWIIGLVGKECNYINGYVNCGKIGPDRTPVYAYNGISPGKNVKSLSSFYTWFHDSNYTINIPFSIPLTKSNGAYKYPFIYLFLHIYLMG